MQKIREIKHAFSRCEHILIEIKRYLRDSEFIDHDLIMKLQQLLDDN